MVTYILLSVRILPVCTFFYRCNVRTRDSRFHMEKTKRKTHGSDQGNLILLLAALCVPRFVGYKCSDDLHNV